MQGLISVTQKSIFASKPLNETVLIYMVRRSETAILEDSTYLISLDEGLMNQTVFLIEQTKMNTECIQQVKIPLSPFEVVNR